MPLGGNKEVTGSHKGYGYGMICELFSSILSMGVTSDQCCTFPDKTGICHGFMAINPAYFGNPDEIRKHFSEYLEALRESPKADGKDRIYTHGEKEVFAEKERREIIQNMLKESFTKEQIKKVLKATDTEIARVEKEMLVK